MRVIEHWVVRIERKSGVATQTESAKQEPSKESLYYRIDNTDGATIMINHDEINLIEWWPVYKGNDDD